MKRLADVVGMAFGSAISVTMMAFVFLSLPFNVITLMRWMGREWWTALIAAMFLNVIPVAGQIAYVVFAVMGGYFFVSSGFSFERAVHPYSILVQSEGVTGRTFDDYKVNILQPELARRCRDEGRNRYANAEGTLPNAVDRYCDCYARVTVELITPEDMTANPSPALAGMIGAAVTAQCTSKSTRL